MPGYEPADSEDIPESTPHFLNPEVMAREEGPDVDFSKPYSIQFNISGTDMTAQVSILSERSLLVDNYNVISCRIDSLDENSAEILKDFIVENL